MKSLFKIATINNISNVGLKRFPKNLYKIESLETYKPSDNPRAIMLRSHKLKEVKFVNLYKLLLDVELVRIIFLLIK